MALDPHLPVRCRRAFSRAFFNALLVTALARTTSAEEEDRDGPRADAADDSNEPEVARHGGGGDADEPSSARHAGGEGTKESNARHGSIEGADEPSSARLPRYFFRAGFETTLRDFADTESAPGAARTYHAFPIPGFAVSAEAYPLLGGLLGVDASFAESIGVHSTTNTLTSVDTTYLRAEGALKGRIPFSSKDSAPWLAVFAGYGYTSYTFGAVPPDREIPSARYNALRFGSDARLRLSRFHFVAAAEYDHLVAIGNLGPTNPQTPGHGVTARLGAGFAFVPWLVGGVDGRLSWFTYDFVRTPSAQGTDLYLTIALTLEALF